jgi:hypothetical protein
MTIQASAALTLSTSATVRRPFAGRSFKIVEHFSWFSVSSRCLCPSCALIQGFRTRPYKPITAPRLTSTAELRHRTLQSLHGGITPCKIPRPQARIQDLRRSSRSPNDPGTRSISGEASGINKILAYLYVGT